MPLTMTRPAPGQLTLTASDDAEPAAAIDGLIDLLTAAQKVSYGASLTPAVIAAATDALDALVNVAAALDLPSALDMQLTGDPAAVTAMLPLLDVIAKTQAHARRSNADSGSAAAYPDK